MQDDDAATPEEQAEAAALARALEAPAQGHGVPAADLATAALLQHERRVQGFDATAQGRVEQRIGATQPAARGRTRRLGLWLVPVGALAAAGVVVFMLGGERASAPEATRLMPLPRPSRALVEAQARALELESPEPLELPMRAHRGALLAAMRVRNRGTE